MEFMTNEGIQNILDELNDDLENARSSLNKLEDIAEEYSYLDDCILDLNNLVTAIERKIEMYDEMYNSSRESQQEREYQNIEYMEAV